MTGKLYPGQKIVISEVTAILQFSDIPVREALKRLESENWVKPIAHVGFHVAGLTTKEIKDVFHVRIELEALAVKQSFEHLKSTVLQELDALVHEMDNCNANLKYEEYWQFNKIFHEKLYSGCENNCLLNLILQLCESSDRSRAIFTLEPGRAVESNREHKVILENLLQGRLEESVLGIKIHLHNALNAITSSRLVTKDL